MILDEAFKLREVLRMAIHGREPKVSGLMSQYTLPTSRGTRIVLADEGLEGGAKGVHQA
jgi:hypothetical protein